MINLVTSIHSDFNKEQMKLIGNFVSSYDALIKHINIMYPNTDLDIHIGYVDSDFMFDYGCDQDEDVPMGMFYKSLLLTELEEIDEKTTRVHQSYDLADRYQIFINIEQCFNALPSFPDHIDIISMYTTLPHEIIHAIEFFKQSHKTPLELYDETNSIDGIVNIQNKVEQKFIKLGINEEDFCEEKGSLLTDFVDSETSFVLDSIKIMDKKSIPNLTAH